VRHQDQAYTRYLDRKTDGFPDVQVGKYDPVVGSVGDFSHHLASGLLIVKDFKVLARNPFLRIEEQSGYSNPKGFAARV
jgi:hypothetical protein